MKPWIMLICVLLAQAALAAEPIGRLFSTPDERARLEVVRQTKKVMIPQAIEVEQQPAVIIDKPVLPNTVTLQGYVKRSDGKKGTVWINQQAVQEDASNDEVAVGRLSANSNRVPVKIKANGKQFSLKAGQQYAPDTNQVREMRSTYQGDSATDDITQSGVIDATTER
ncbi:MAG TPA: hypothetical protein VGD04_07385 [Methylophilus sp.]